MEVPADVGTTRRRHSAPTPQCTQPKYSIGGFCGGGGGPQILATTQIFQ